MRTDLVIHFIVGALLGFGFALWLGPGVGILAAALAGIGRELSQEKRDNADILWTVIGGLLGAWVAVL